MVDEVVGTGQPDIKSETDMMKKIFQNKINHLTTENEQLKKDLEEEKKKKEKILNNARRKIKQLTADMEELRKNHSPETKPETVRPLPDGKASNGKSFS